MREHALAAICLSATAFASPSAADEWRPTRAIEFIAAAGPGGGTDVFARVVQSAINKNKLLDQPIIVTNKAGGSGAEAFISAKTSPNDPYKLYFGTQDVYALPLGSKLSYSLGDLQPISAMTFDPFLLWVNPSSGILDAKDFVAKAKEKPGAFKMGGAKAKEADETLVSLIEGATGAKLTYIPYKSGSEAAVQLAGGHITGNVNNPSESVEQWRAGLQKPLCVFDEKPLPGKEVIADGRSWSSIPTCEEAGIAVRTFQQPRTIWAAAKVPPEVVAFYTALFHKVTETPEWKAYVEQGAQIPTVLVGDAFKKFIEQHKTSYAEIYERNGWLVH
jgi:tripartite-type tricarboxylate transporter receptor subunit TctC